MAVGGLLVILTIFAVLGVMFLASALLLIVILKQSAARKGRMGINVRREDCPAAA